MRSRWRSPSSTSQTPRSHLQTRITKTSVTTRTKTRIQIKTMKENKSFTRQLQWLSIYENLLSLAFSTGKRQLSYHLLFRSFIILRSWIQCRTSPHCKKKPQGVNIPIASSVVVLF
uniref:Uncharacterized protein n=1 Tax=Lepeophtheirus salmonis TaxID=72036 RepID=A0A0K2UD94_LEPSM